MISRPIKIEGFPSATIYSHVFIGTNLVTLRDINLMGGLRTGLAQNLKLHRVRLASGNKDQALAAHRSHIELKDTVIEGGYLAAIEVSSSTITASNLELNGANAARGLLLHKSQFQADHSIFSGGHKSTIHVSRGSKLSIRVSQLSASSGDGIIIRGHKSSSELIQTTISEINGNCISIFDGRLSIDSSSLLKTNGSTLRVSGGNIKIQNSVLYGGSTSTIDASSLKNLTPSLVVQNSAIQYKPNTPAIISNAASIIANNVVISPIINNESVLSEAPLVATILIKGARTIFTMAHSQIKQTFGPAINAQNDAQLNLDHIEFSNSYSDAIRIEDIRSQPVNITNVRVKGCKHGAGIRALSSRPVHIKEATIEDCSEGGIIFGTNSQGSVRRVNISGGRLGVGAFGGAHMSVSTATISGSVWSAFGDCIHNTRLRDDGDTVLRGHSRLCL